jgi:hypothetical protein
MSKGIFLVAAPVQAPVHYKTTLLLYSNTYYNTVGRKKFRRKARFGHEISATGGNNDVAAKQRDPVDYEYVKVFSLAQKKERERARETLRKTHASFF